MSEDRDAQVDLVRGLIETLFRVRRFVEAVQPNPSGVDAQRALWQIKSTLDRDVPQLKQDLASSLEATQAEISAGQSQLAEAIRKLRGEGGELNIPDLFREDPTSTIEALKDDQTAWIDSRRRAEREQS